MQKSRYTLITDIDGENYAVSNPLSGAFDIADKEDVDAVEKGIPRNDDEKEYWLNRGYFFKSASEEKIYVAKRYQDVKNETSSGQKQYMLVLNYGCNFDCQYCYQKNIPPESNLITKEMIDAFLKYISIEREKEAFEPVITLFGGEPLLKSEKRYSIVKYLVDGIKANGYFLSIVSNGYYLIDYLDLFSADFVKEIHLTMDGFKDIHNKRRTPKNVSDSFDRLIDGIEKALNKKIPINIRLMIDKLSLASLPDLADFLNKKGFLDLPVSMFKTSLGRIYKLIDENVNEDSVFTLDRMYEEYTKLMQQYPILEKLHKPSYFGITNIIETGQMLLPNFDSCPAGKTELVFDNFGKIYGCTASCGRKNYELGDYFPKIKINNNEMEKWRNRNIMTIEKCKECPFGVVCGGGCGVIAKEKNGEIMSENCKPVKEIMDIGIRYYKNKLLKSTNYTASILNCQ